MNKISIQDYLLLFKDAVEKHRHTDEPLPEISNESIGKIEAYLEMPFQNVFGQELYPSIYDKAAILLYLMIKNHPLPNGNKRMAFLSMYFLLYINYIRLNISQDNVYELTKNVAASNPDEKDLIIDYIKSTISTNNTMTKQELQDKISDLKKRSENKSLPASAIAKLNEMIAEYEKKLSEMGKLEEIKKIVSPTKETEAISYKKKKDMPKMARKYKLGDQYRSDFDYEGLLKYSLKVNEDTDIKTLEKLHSSFEDNNFHTLGRPLWDSVALLKTGKKEEAAKKMNEFHKAIEKELKDELRIGVPKKKESKKEKEGKGIDALVEGAKEAEKKESDMPNCDDLLNSYLERRKKIKEAKEKRENQGKPATHTANEVADKAVEKIADKIEKKAEKGQSVKRDLKSVLNTFTEGIKELHQYKSEVDKNEVLKLIRELKKLL